jgi:hypothetical protein
MWGWVRMSGVVPGCVCVPDVYEDIGEGLAGLYVDDADVEELVDGKFYSVWREIMKEEEHTVSKPN